MLTGVRTTGACVTVRITVNRRMDAWSRNTHHKCCFLVAWVNVYFRHEICNAARYATECTCNIRNGTMACDRYRFGSLSSFRVAPAGSSTSQRAWRQLLPLTLRAAPTFTTISSCSGLSCGCLVRARISHFVMTRHGQSVFEERRAHSELEAVSMAGPIIPVFSWPYSPAGLPRAGVYASRWPNVTACGPRWRGG
jgi:hypothetical protein